MTNTSKLMVERLMLLMVLFYGLGSRTLYAQGVPPPQIFQPTPQTQIFERYMNHSITEYNGLPQISIPLYEMVIKGLKIPITLSYHAGGVKYKGYDGEVGAGWSINAGGFRIFRTIYGKPDDLFPFYNEMTQASYGTGNSGNDAYLAGIGLNDGGQMMVAIPGNIYRDGEYDQFSYMLPSTNGKFLISDRTNKSTDKANSNQDKIILDEGSSTLKLDSIKIIDNAGFEYYAGGIRSGSALLAETSRANNFYKTAWPLARIKSPYNETVNFKYNLYDVNMERESHYNYTINDAEITEGYGIDGSVGTMYTYSVSDPTEISNIVEKMFFIGEISSETETIAFNRVPGSEMLTGITVTNKLSGAVTNISFNYTLSGIHNLLAGLTVDGKVYSFDYHDGPANLMQAYPDQWGYYKYPNTEGDYFGLFLHQEFKDDYFLKNYTQLLPFPGIRVDKQIKDELLYLYPKWIDRVTNDNPFYYSLKRIHFPTGGTTEYEYEPNQYRDTFESDPLPKIIKGAGQRIKKIISRPIIGQSLATIFKYGENEDGNGVVDYDYLRNIKNRYVNEINTYNFPNGFYFQTYIKTTHRTYSSKPLDGDIDMNLPIEYGKITTYQFDSLQNQFNGKVVAKYNIPSKYNLLPMNNITSANEMDRYTRFISLYSLGKEPTLSSRMVYDKNNLIIKKENYTYNGVGTGTYNGIKVKQTNFFSTITDFNYEVVNSYFQTRNTGVNYTVNLLSSKIDSLFENGGNPIVTAENYLYNANNQLVTKTVNTSNSGSYVKEFTYPSTAAGTVYGQMVAKNIISPIIKEVTKNNGVEIETIKNNFSDNASVTTGLILPVSIQTSFTGEPNLRTDLTYDRYDSKGNLLQFTKLGVVTSYLWGYKNKFPIAEIQNATYDQASTALLLSGLSVSALATSSVPDMTKVDALRSSLGNALVTTYTYTPSAGFSSVTDAKGLKVSYEYDSYNRLILKKDHNGQIINAYDYNYKP